MSLFDFEARGRSSSEKLLLELASAAIDAAQPHSCVPEAVSRIFTKPPAGRTFVFGAGKAAAQMAASFEIAYPWRVKGFVVTRTGFGCDTRTIQIMEASHPVPDDSSERAGRALLEAMASTSETDRVVFLLSGGCSSLIFTPTQDIERERAWQFLTSLLNSGIPVDTMNRIRQALSITGGGGLAAACPGDLTTLAISDVVGDRAEDIGSAPTTYPSPVTPSDLKMLEQCIESVPPDILSSLRHTPSCLSSRIEKASNAFHLIASSHQALERATRIAREASPDELICDPDVTGAVQMAAHRHADLLEAISRSGKSALLLSGGELTVALKHGARLSVKGGPNQEYALRLCRALHERKLSAAILSIDTDGIDGQGDAAGGLITTEAYSCLLNQGINVDSLLDKNESYQLLEAANALLKPGPTGTNVNDFRAVLISRKSRE